MPLDLRQRLFAKLYDRATARYERLLHPRKRELLAGLSGRLVEIGPGTGANLDLFPSGVEWIGIEPNAHMHPALRKKAEALGIRVDLRELSAGRLPLEDESVDAVLSTLVLCSVPDTAQVLAEIRRVLKPGGRFYFWEHVLAREGEALRALQHCLTPLHRLLADGCRCNRDLARDIRGAGFRTVELEEFRVPAAAAPTWVRPHIRGIATR
jgi:ubiquinone/menaquinone biosynthesis C-methylase UbiE